ncbi:hypothetical protein ACLOJK_002537 [Asimina triloba]
MDMEEARAALQKDPWIGAAMFDDSLVAEVLLRLSRAAAAAAAVEPAPLPQLRWGLRLPRSRQIHRASVLQSKKAEDCTDDDVARGGSPTTPLSWYGGSGSSSHSGSGGEACVESSRSGNPVVVSRNSADCGRSKSCEVNVRRTPNGVSSDLESAFRKRVGARRLRSVFSVVPFLDNAFSNVSGRVLPAGMGKLRVLSIFGFSIRDLSVFASVSSVPSKLRPRSTESMLLRSWIWLIGTVEETRTLRE